MINTPTARESDMIEQSVHENKKLEVEDEEEEAESVNSSSKSIDGTESTVYSDSSTHSFDSIPSDKGHPTAVPLPRQTSSSSLPSNSSSCPEDTASLDGGSEAFAAAKAASKAGSARRPSLKQSSLREEIPIKNERSSWMQLPQPDLEQIRNSAFLRHSVTLPLSLEDFDKPSTCASKKKSPQVSFRDVTIREFDQCITDNPSVSYGPPIGLDWNFSELAPIAIDDYETIRGPQRARKNMALSYYHRIRILEHLFGYSKEELKKAHKEADREKLKRAVTKYFLPAQKMEEAFQSAGRKTRRYLGRRRHSSTV